MYQIRYDNHILYDPRVANDRDKLRLLDFNARFSVSAAGSVSMTLPPDHPLLGKLAVRMGRVELLDDGYTTFRGHPIRKTTAFDGRLTVECEGDMAYLNDSAVAPYNFPEDYLEDLDYQQAAKSGNVIAFWLKKLIERHNRQTSPRQQLHLGEVTVKDPNNYITRSNSKFSTTWETISEKLIKSSLGGYLLPRYEQDGTYIDYLAELPYTNVQEVRYAHNLLNQTTEQDGTDVFSAVIPIGAESLTIETLPDGPITEDVIKDGVMVYSKQARQRYGNVTRSMEFKNVTTLPVLQQRAVQALAVGMGLPESIEVSAIDLHAVDGSIPSFRVGRLVRVVDPAGHTAVYPLTEISPKILEPGATRIVLGRAQRSYMTDIRDQTHQTNQRIEDERKKTDNQISQVTRTTTEQISQIIQDANGIVMSALSDYVQTNDLEQFKKTVEAALSVLPGQIRAEVSQEITTAVQDGTGDIRVTVEQINKYLSFDAILGLLIGAEDSIWKMQISNEGYNLLQGQLAIQSGNAKGIYTPSLWIRPMDPDDDTDGAIHIGDIITQEAEDGSVVTIYAGGGGR